MIKIGAFFKINGIKDITEISKRFKAEYWTFENHKDVWYLILKPSDFSCTTIVSQFVEFTNFTAKVQSRIPGFKVEGTEYVTDLPTINFTDIIEEP